ncbi:MAG: glycosyltransferase, partial [Bryobacterales bacterium]|nr:glycosyltransferase [Bryobacterales bacterium]
MPHLSDVFLAIAAIPFIYCFIAIYSSWRYFRQPAQPPDPSFVPPVSILKPIRGLDPEAWENLASFCRLDYPGYEIVFCIDPEEATVVSLLAKLKAAFPQSRIRVLHGSGRVAANDKVAKLARLVSEASHEVVVISDSDVRVGPDYLRQVTAPLHDSKIGAVTCFYLPIKLTTVTDQLQNVGMMSDFYAGILVAWQLDGVKFALGPTIATTRTRLNSFGGYPELENRPADDLLVGRL